MSLKDEAHRYANAGFAVFPVHSMRDGACSCGRACSSPGKHPRTHDGMKSATRDHNAIAAWWTEWPDANIAIATGEPSGVVVVDLDVKDGRDGFASLARVLGGAAFPETLAADTGGGGMHLFFKWPGERVPNSANKIGPGIDVRGDGGYVLLAPSNHKSGRPYAWINFEQGELLDMPEWVAKRRQPKSRKAGAEQKEDAAKFLAGGRNDALTSLAGTMRRRGMSPEAILAALLEENGVRCHPPLSDDEVRKVAASVARYEPDEPKGVLALATQAVEGEADGDGWRGTLLENATGGIRLTIGNACIMWRHHPALRGRLRHDVRAARDLVVAPLPWSEAIGRSVTDADHVHAAEWFEQRCGLAFGPGILSEAMRTIADESAFDPVYDWIGGLVWDGRPRLDNWPSAYLDAHDPARSGARWLMSAVARVLWPGCQADHVLVLEGPQGSLKSSALRAIAGDEWFADDVGQIGEKSSIEAIAGRWIVEIAELAAVRRVDMEAVKAFLTRREDSFRPAYGRSVVHRLRRCVFAATTNDGAWLTDQSGGRRFWPLRVQRADVEGLRRARAQLIAEAAMRVVDGEIWHMTETADVDHMTEAQHERQAGDVVTELIETYLRGRTTTSLRQVITEALNVEKKDAARYDLRVSKSLAALGWRRRTVRGPDGHQFRIYLSAETVAPRFEELVGVNVGVRLRSV